MKAVSETEGWSMNIVLTTFTDISEMILVSTRIIPDKFSSAEVHSILIHSFCRFLLLSLIFCGIMSLKYYLSDKSGFVK